MGEEKGLSKGLRRVFSGLDREKREILAEGLPFYLFLTLILLGVAIRVVVQSQSILDASKISIFIVLMTAHIVLHWFSGWSLLKYRWSVAYIIVQGVFGFILPVYVGQPDLTFALFGALIGEAIGVYGLRWLTAITVIGYVLVGELTIFMIGGLDAVQSFGNLFLMICVMLVVLMVLIRRALDAGERSKALLQELEIAYAELADYSSRVESLTIEAERERMARELHDTLAQGLAGLVMQLEAVNHHLDTGKTQKAQVIVGHAMERARTTLAESRQAIQNLRTDSQSTMRGMVQNAVDQFSKSTGIPCELKLDLAEDAVVSADVQEHTERILGEALTNIARHAGPSRASVQLVNREKNLVLEIEDDGVGFDPEALPDDGHYGLRGIRERIHLIGGQLDIQSAPGDGSRIRAVLPKNPKLEVEAS